MMQMNHYAMITYGHLSEIDSLNSPDLFLKHMLAFRKTFDLIGASKLELYWQQDQLWIPIYGVNNLSPRLFLIPSEEVFTFESIEKEKGDIQDQYKQLGRRVEETYKILQTKYHNAIRQYKRCTPDHKRKLQKHVELMEHYILAIDLLVQDYNGEIKEAFDLSVKKRFNPIECARKLHIGERTWFRRTAELQTVIGYEFLKLPYEERKGILVFLKDSEWQPDPKFFKSTP